jgi:hypothetical protein
MFLTFGKLISKITRQSGGGMTIETIPPAWKAKCRHRQSTKLNRANRQTVKEFAESVPDVMAWRLIELYESW